MKILKPTVFLPAFAALILGGCNYLDERPYDWAQPKDVFSMEMNYERPVNQAYSYLPGALHRVSGAFLDAATDDGIFTVGTAAIHRISRGYITSSTTVVGPWHGSYWGIRQALFVQKSLSEIELALNNKSSEQVQAIKDIYSGEMYALRALYEFDLLKHYGGYPIVDKYYSLGDPELTTKRRSSFSESAGHIGALCDSAIKYLPLTPIAGNGGYGRMTKGAAMAIKAKMLVYAASPLFNQMGNKNPLVGFTNSTETDVKARWETAAEACAAVINLKNAGGAAMYSLHANYEKLFVSSPNSEYIVFAGAPKSNDLENRQLPPTLSRNSGGGSVPTQELVNAFTRLDGTPYVEGSLDQQYKNRDPRLALIIGFNGSTYGPLGLVQTKLGDGATQDALNAVEYKSTNTGYYLKKFLDTNVKFSIASPATAFHLVPLIRLADILLLYAEAMNEAYGADADPKGFGLTAKGAVQKIRTRAGFKADDKFLVNVSDPIAMRDKIKQERRIELCFEEQRYFDLRRWMDGAELDKAVTGIRIEQKGNVLEHSYFIVDALRKFEPKMYLHPIPLNETIISPQITQNPGW